LIGVRSVFRFGIVQVSATWLPARLADKSPTTVGRFSEGGCGAPGVPQPASTPHIASPRAPQSFRPKEITS
jgi:hypothetical protein